jgi:hypothetical protein
MRKHRGALNAFTQLKQPVTKLCNICDILEKGKLWRQCQDQCLPEVETKEAQTVGT